ncbi:hypothetical protein CKM354_000908600 [Cercospora kikuchii]|uniref:Fungal STAND N-terminal Goodbye domain-containing protein n=1 Tax=Cercospora kikuchii TaxID=84275 RepID=A0A9P3CUG2_9PEZI|nr:uncharacterized protein CKM354_000908600 [Cercospora kikuchii]GIZ45940.1 hypothetical protein CKM354_000908600 [Cercospora kikuchii]
MPPFSGAPAASPITPADRTNKSAMLSEEDDLDTVWADVISRCSKITKWDLNDRRSLTIDEVVGRIIPPKDKKAAESTGKAKEVFRNALVCVQRFGDIAANAASMVFGPSQQCFNAISFVISAVQEYDDVFNNITALMERVSVFLERLRIYLDDTDAKTKLDKRLRLTTYRVLEHFLMIMGLAHKLTRGWKAKWKLAAKIAAFGDDDGVKDALATLERLIANQTQTEITVIVKDMSEAAKNIRSLNSKLDTIADAQEKAASSLGFLQTAEERRKAEDEDRKRLETVREALNIDSTKKPWTEKQDELWGKHIEGTGNWLLEYKAPGMSFARWADPKQPDLNVLSVKADEGFGKSFLCSIVVKHLQEKHREDSRICVAYYYFARDVQDKSPINRAMKAIIWQLASSITTVSRDYLKLAAKVCGSNKDFGRTADLWQKLVSEAAKHLDATFYIVLDGIDETESEAGKPLASIITQIMQPEKDALLRVRLFLTGRASGLDALSDDVESHIPQIKIAGQADQKSLNEDDILLYAESRLDDMDIFTNKSERNADKIVELKERARTELGTGVKGDYFALDYKLDSVSKSRNFREVEEVLSLARESRSQAIAREINQLNDTLRKDEIREVNDLLMWVITAFQYLSIDQCESVLRLKADTFTLVALEKQIKEKYYSLFDVDDEKLVTMRSDDIREYLDKKDEDTLKDNGSTHLKLHSSEHVALQEGEIALVKRVLQTHLKNIFGGDDLYERFDFDAFFASKLGDQAVRIHLEPMNISHVRLSQACLVAICDKFGEEEYASFHVYAYEWFADHLRAISDNDDIDVATKQDVGRKLVRILREEALIAEWWSAERMFLKSYWVFGTSCLDAVFKWLSDPVVQRGMLDMPTERQWVISATSDDTTPTQILVNVAKFMAKKWYDQDDPSGDAFWWLYGYHNQKGEEPPEIYGDVTPADIERIEEWAKETIDDTDDPAQWHKCMAETLSATGNYLAAIPRTQKAIELRADDWELKFSLVQSQYLAKDPTSAMNTIESLFRDHEALLSSGDDAYKEFHYRSLLPYYGSLQRERKDYTAAEKTYSDLLEEAMKRPEVDFFFQSSVVRLIEVLRAQEKHENVLRFLQDLDAKEHGTEGSTWLTEVMYYYERSGGLHDPICDSARRVSQLDFLEKRYTKALQVHLNAPESGTKWCILLYLGLCHSRVLRATALLENRLLAMEEMEQNLYKPLSEELEDDGYVSDVLGLHATKLAIDLLDMAKETGLSLPLSSEATQYAIRLEKLTHLRDSIAQQEHQDLRITLARFWHLAGDERRAKDAVREYLKRGMEWMQTEENFKNGFYRLAVTMQALDDDVNAVAAWSVFTPSNIDTEDDIALYAVDETVEKDTGMAERKNEDGATSTAPAPEALSEQAVAGAEREDADAQDSEKEQKPSANKPAATTEEDKTAAPKKREKLEGILTSSCDGRCGTEWTYIDRMIYSCKDCLDVQFEENCYQKLIAGELGPNICSSKHSHLVIPAFDFMKWRQISDPKTQSWVGGEIKLDTEWLEGIKMEWGIDEKSLERKRKFVEGVRMVQRLWRVRKKEGGSESVGPGPLSRRGTALKPRLAGGASGVATAA